VHGIAGIEALGFGRAVLLCMALSSTEVTVVIGSSPCYQGHGGFVDSINNFKGLVWMGLGGGAGVLPLSGGEVHDGKTSWGKTRGCGGRGILSHGVAGPFSFLLSCSNSVVKCQQLFFKFFHGFGSRAKDPSVFRLVRQSYL
jgi:hypothetical protein